SAIVVDGETGLIVPSGVPAATADALARLIEDPAARNRLGANGRKRYEQHFSARRMTERIEAVYNGVLSGRRRTLPRPAAIRYPVGRPQNTDRSLVRGRWAAGGVRSR